MNMENQSMEEWLQENRIWVPFQVLTKIENGRLNADSFSVGGWKETGKVTDYTAVLDDSQSNSRISDVMAKVLFLSNDMKFINDDFANINCDELSYGPQIFKTKNEYGYYSIPKETKLIKVNTQKDEEGHQVLWYVPELLYDKYCRDRGIENLLTKKTVAIEEDTLPFSEMLERVGISKTSIQTLLARMSKVEGALLRRYERLMGRNSSQEIRGEQSQEKRGEEVSIS